ncbi:integrin alpha-4 [Nilaparvata lugens]|uniref:integrin alpha-4 n=1 Tax=Nilaparvata lugens TaxID=108931 RepID=UPI00193E1171|nr:integrin alpha-4 [Nilaparvata lugens]
MFGISADFEKVRDGWSALIGSINLKTWNGEISKLEGHMHRAKEFLKDDPDKNEQIKNSYFGYAITVGKSDSEDLLYVSSPRSWPAGKVEVYKKQEGDVHPYFVRVHHGEQTGEMFGASLCAADFNGDGVEDLIVGAPFYAGSELSFNEGRISVISSRGSRMYDENNFYGKRNKAGSQFGLALSAIGDLNMDGLPDIAVGAPHEDDVGAIYIFLGDRQNGIRLSQHIKASDIDPSLKGFGISMTGEQDIDSNGFDDIGVGCYLSSNVVLLKTKPIIKLSGSLGILSDFKEGKISVNSEPLLIYACVHYEQGHLKTDVAYVRIDIDVDQKLKRTKSVQLNSTLVNSALKGNQIKVDTEIAYNTQFCLNFTFQLQEEIKNRNNELLIEMRFSTVTDDERCKKKECPMIDQNLENEVTELRLPFKTYTTDLQLSSKFINTNGSSYMHSAGNKNLAIEVKIVNKKDMALSTKLEIKMPSILSVKYVEGNERCKALTQVLTQTEAAKTDYYCNFRNVERNEEPTIILHVSTSDLTEDVDDLIFNFTVSSASKELDIRDNDSSLQLFVNVDTPLFISGFANPPEIIISKAVDDEANNDFKHTFDVSNKSPMKLTVSVNITVPIPVIVSDAERIPMFLLQSKLQLSNGSQLPCSSDADENIKKYFIEWNDTGLPNQDFTRGLSEKLKSSAKNVMKSNFDCNHQSQSTESSITIACVNISCSNFLFYGNATIEVRMRSSYKVFDYLIGTDGTRKFITRASVFLSRYRQKFHLHGNLETAVETPISINIHKSPIWPFILAIVLSLVLLILITYGLYKAKFFKRNRVNKDISNDAGATSTENLLT